MLSYFPLTHTVHPINDSEGSRRRVKASHAVPIPLQAVYYVKKHISHAFHTLLSHYYAIFLLSLLVHYNPSHPDDFPADNTLNISKHPSGLCLFKATPGVRAFLTLI